MNPPSLFYYIFGQNKRAQGCTSKSYTFKLDSWSTSFLELDLELDLSGRIFVLDHLVMFPFCCLSRCDIIYS